MGDSVSERVTVAPISLTEFLRDQAQLDEDEFLERWTGAFLLGRSAKIPPTLLAVPRDVDVVKTLGSDAGCDFAFPDDASLDPRHLEIQFHKGFQGWVVRDLKTQRGTRVQGETIATDRTHLLEDRAKVHPGQGETVLQIYLPETLYERLCGAGVTARLAKLATDAPPTIRAHKQALPAPAREPDPEPEELPDEDALLGWLCTQGEPSLALRPGTTVTIGRGHSCVLRLDDDAVSRRHGLVRVSRAGRIVYTDRSSNGTLLNGGRVKKLADTPLKVSDKLEFGAIKVVVRAPNDPRATEES